MFFFFNIFYFFTDLMIEQYDFLFDYNQSFELNFNYCYFCSSYFNNFYYIFFKKNIYVLFTYINLIKIGNNIFFFTYTYLNVI